ncbi:MAG TPA: M23 family metallopeptidase [Polaromonas sp.]|uniref:M23 family metallopeptidase n=1 Tax=Polaromonas sp. TaxID=1869339 RepID=UPI002D3E38C6|nr:M23 family metallopeptidase [Polaromonas sp.]HYW58179.1 M23 family metallopeptidase [Polaromonas sp.]
MPERPVRHWGGWVAAVAFVLGVLWALNRPAPTTTSASEPPVTSVPTAKPPSAGLGKTAPSPSSPPSPPPQAAVQTPEPATGIPPLLLPVQGVSPRDLRDTFADTRDANQRGHEAIDIMAPRGTPVFAVDDGRIVKLFSSKPGGITVYQFDPTGNFAYYYAHLDAYAEGLAEGQTVKRGSVIGFVGYTGNANPAAPHLHFAIFKLGPEKQWWKGEPINPFEYLGGKKP